MPRRIVIISYLLTLIAFAGYGQDECPQNVKKRKKSNGVVIIKGKKRNVLNYQSHEARIEKKEHTLQFEAVQLEEVNLDIPLFQQFENNQTHFTAEGEKEFNDFTSLLSEALDKVKYGNQLVIHITGGASQIPTSFDPNKPNNNVNKDGSSIVGQTSIENNKMLAHERALEVADRIKKQFPNVKIVTPDLNEIELGTEVWTVDHKARLDGFFLSNHHDSITELYKPFKKDQFVKVELKSTFVKTIDPKRVKMYAVASHPRFIHKIEGGSCEVHGPLIVSKSTYDLIGGKQEFSSKEERDRFLKEQGLEIGYCNVNGYDRWYIVSNEAEKKALEIDDNVERTKALYQLGLVHFKDQETLKEILTQESIDQQRYSYTVKDCLACIGQSIDK